MAHTLTIFNPIWPMLQNLSKNSDTCTLYNVTCTCTNSSAKFGTLTVLKHQPKGGYTS